MSTDAACSHCTYLSHTHPTQVLFTSRLFPCLAQVPISAQALMTAALQTAGGFNTAVEDFSALITLARNQGAIGGQNRGACRICGQLGHLTKQCRNHLSAHFQAPTTAEAAAAAAASGKPLLPSIPAGPQAEDLSDLSSLSSNGSGSGSESDSESAKRKRKHKVTYSSSRTLRCFKGRCRRDEFYGVFIVCCVLALHCMFVGLNLEK